MKTEAFGMRISYTVMITLPLPLVPITIPNIMTAGASADVGLIAF